MNTTVVKPEETLLARLAGVQAGTPLAAALAVRAEAVLSADASGRMLFDTVDVLRLGLNERLAMALASSEVHSDGLLVRHYITGLSAVGGAPMDNHSEQAALRHIRLLAAAPVRASAADLRALEAAGWSADAILTIAQIAAFTSFQSRYLAGLRLIAGKSHPAPSTAAVVPAGAWHMQPLTTAGQPAPIAFTRDDLDWEPWLAPRERSSLSPEEARQLEKAGHLKSDYFMLLARDLPVLEQRTRTDKGIFYTHGGLSRAERELAATVTSKVNGCIYCASVHARKSAQLSGELAAIDRLLAVPPNGDLAEGQSERWQAQIRFAAQLSAAPQSALPIHLEALRAQGLTDLELLDLVGAVAFFSWANRLMLTLGEPFKRVQ